MKIVIIFLLVFALLFLFNMGATWLICWAFAAFGITLPFWPVFVLFLVVGYLFRLAGSNK